MPCARRVFYFTAGGFGILVRSSVELDSASGQYDGETLPHTWIYVIAGKIQIW